MVAQGSSRVEGKAEFTKHMIAFLVHPLRVAPIVRVVAGSNALIDSLL